MRKALRELPGYWKSALICGGLFYLVAVLLGLLLLGQKAQLPTAEAEADTQQQEDWPELETHRIDDRIVVVIDSGHGGYEPGAVDASGTVTEAEANQQMVDRVLALLALHPNEILAMQSHQPGTYATAMQRANTAVAQEADLMVSLHLNADESPYIRGFSCFPTPPGRLYHPESYRFAQLLCQRVQPTGVPILGENGIYYHYYIPLAGGGYSKYIVPSSQVTEDDPWPEESFGVVEYSGCPAVLVEQWHISSPADMALLYHSEGMDTMAECIYLAICDYFELTPMLN